MSTAKSKVLVDLMNDSNDPKRLVELADQVFYSVVPFANREKQDKVVRAAVMLMAVGTSNGKIAESLHNAEDGRQPLSYYEKIVDRIHTIAEAKAAAEVKDKPSAATFLRAAISYADVMAGRAAPSEELTSLAKSMGGDYERAGRAAMLEAMQMLITPSAVELTPELIRFAARLNGAIEEKALDAVDARPGDRFVAADVDEGGKISVTLASDAGERTLDVPEAEVTKYEQTPEFA